MPPKTFLETFQKPSVKILLLSNLVVIVMAVYQHWSLPTLFWSYWVQSVIIGLFQFYKILDLKNFSTEGFKINGRSVEPTEKNKKQTAYFFLFHYGFFHFAYAIFLVGMSGVVAWDTVEIAGAVFLINHIISYRTNKATDSSRVPNIGKIMFFPYWRIIPMHLSIIFILPFADSIPALVFFLVLKTTADTMMHVIEHELANVVVN
ncbi:MAG: hypothetical protein COX81_02740 [Candidatus Magasanikbacteria bacterium CG_4_10_14_0_2_um_filter_37_12]|uniref:Uncharacterized protein n=1 Tax=Candidatus Magasanikbacteria bacterium CG_4_10_14_0_2_um_filter_37_12 TaxID=1974637 RepID=A0A2M7V7L5_9BACT|nr:MAG: hypothetical protein COX81_02740 [Candidatus Magasanikbacteria bacterium CG_4_10_14_0_2_um_filter_37_12]